MTKKKKKNEKNNLIIAIVGVIAIIAIVAGSTFAYWSWRSDAANQTNVVVTVKGAEMPIVGPIFTSNTLRPTNDCDGAATISGEVTISVINHTETFMRATPRLDVTLKPKSGRTLTSDALSHLHWALVETTSSTTMTCSNPDYQGTFDKVIKPAVTRDSNQNVIVSYSSLSPSAVTANAKTTIDITKNIDSFTSDTQQANTLTFQAAKATSTAQGAITPVTTTKKYTLYIWLDDSYTFQNVGNTVTDPMQDLNITVQWSPNSTLFQE